MRKYLVAFLFILMTASLSRCGAAEFDIDAPGTILRRLQYCQDCGAALLVTHIHIGDLVRCPDCGKEQDRLANEYLLTQIYQQCKTCLSPLDASGHHPGDTVECGNCHTRQTLGKDAFLSGPETAGLGYKPGFPPGSVKKHLLFSPERADASITMIPLDRSDPPESPKPALPADTFATAIPRPPRDLLPQRQAPPEPPVSTALSRPVPPAAPQPDPARQPATQPVPPAPAYPEVDLAQARPQHQPATATQPRREQVWEPSPQPMRQTQPVRGTAREPEPARMKTDARTAIDVPAVTVDMFGGRRQQAAAPAGAAKPASIHSGTVAARVNGAPIYRAEIERLVVPIMERLRAAAGGDARMELAERETRLRREVLDRLVERELAYQEAQIMGLTADPGKLRARETELAQVMDSADARREAERDVILADLRQRVVGRQDRVRPEAVREYYQLHKHEQTRPRLTAMTPLVIYQDRVGRRDSRDYRVIAQEIATGLELGTRFEELRRLHDEFVAAAELPPGPPPLLPDDAYAGTILASAGSLRQGAVFGPLFMEGMALFAKVVEEQVEGPVPFAEVEKDIRAVLERQEAEKAYSDWLERLRRRAKIEITD